MDEDLKAAIRQTCKLKTPVTWPNRKRLQKWNCVVCHKYPGSPSDIVEHCKSHIHCRSAILQMVRTASQLQPSTSTSRKQLSGPTRSENPYKRQRGLQDRQDSQSTQDMAEMAEGYFPTAGADVGQASNMQPQQHVPDTPPQQAIDIDREPAQVVQPVWKTVSSHTLTPRDESQKLFFLSFGHSASELLNKIMEAPTVLPEVDEAHPLNQLHNTIAYHLNELPINKPILIKMEKEFPALQEYVMQNSKVFLADLDSSSAKICHDYFMNTDAAELDKIRRIGFFLTRLGPHDSAAQPKLMRALEAAHQFFVQPETQTLDKDPSWNSPEGNAPEISLRVWIIYAIALDKAIDRYGILSKLHSTEPSELERFCLRSALLGKLPTGLTTLYDPNVSVGLSSSHIELLRSRTSSLHDTTGLPSVHYDQKHSAKICSLGEGHVLLLPRYSEVSLQENDDGSSRIVVDFELGDPANANSRAASSWSLGDEAIGQALRLAAANHSTSTVRLTEGVHFGVVIASQPYTFTPAHFEELLLGAVNDLHIGAFKVWAFVPPAKADLFLQLLEKKHGKSSSQTLFCKRRRPLLTVNEMKQVGVQFLFQPSGYTVFSLPGRVFHWTTSLGFSLAEAANFYTSLSDISLAQLHGDWLAEVNRAEKAASNKVAKDAVKKRAVLVANIVDVLKQYDVLK